MSFSDQHVPLWRKVLVTILLVGCLTGTLFGLAVWELWQCGDSYEGYCRERNYLDVLVIGGLPLTAALLAYGATRLLLREPR